MDKKLQKRIIRVAGALEKMAGSAMDRARASYKNHSDKVNAIMDQIAEATASGASMNTLARLEKKFQAAEAKRVKAAGRFVEIVFKPSKSKKASVKKTAELEIKLKKFPWTQIGGDMNPGSYGGIIATSDGNSIEVLNIQPTREYVGDNEALEVGFPFWTSEAYYDLSDLDPSKHGDALSFVGLTEDALEKMAPEERGVAIAEALLQYGTGVDNGPGGWAKDVVPGKVKWWGSKSAQGWKYLADEDREFKQMMKDAQND